MKKSALLLVAAMITAGLTGCATTRGVIQVANPKPITEAQQKVMTQKAIIAFVEDDRVF